MVSLYLFGIAKASTHLENISIQTKRCLLPRGVGGKSIFVLELESITGRFVIRSKAHTQKGAIPLNVG